ncbi:MAG: toll/interleukin-1 receptor domain-containing protein [Anaerolinea sp.]|nr:toll/interleukin-1 receptor domain-containing protein [Anaerolinea sp.]
MTFVFISYSHADKDHAEMLEIQLQERNFEVWRDNRILPGDHWESEILKAIKDCGVFVVLMSDNSLQSAYVNKEIDHAVSLGKTIIPVLLSGDPFPKLSEIQYVNATSQINVTPQFEATIRKAFKNKLTVPKQIQSLEYYVKELEGLLRNTHERPMVGEIIKYQKQHSLLLDSITERLAPYRAPIDIHNLEELDDIFTEWADLAESLRRYAQKVEVDSEDIMSEIQDLQEEWEEVLEEDPDAVEPPPTPPVNFPHMYDRDLFDND